VLFNVIAAEANELWALDVVQRTTKRLLEKPSAFPFAATFSPDGKWFAYGWRENVNVAAAATEIFVEPFPPTGEIHRIAAGLRPLWSRDGKELFFGRPGQSFVVPISTTPTVTFGNATELPIPRSPPFGILERGIRRHTRRATIRVLGARRPLHLGGDPADSHPAELDRRGEEPGAETVMAMRPGASTP
jgi:hypothetical protein